MEDKILLAHGSGGKLSHELIATVFRPAFSNPALDALDDSAVLSMADSRWQMADGTIGYRLSAISQQRLAFTTDSYVVKPLFFPGGDIGRLAVSGTVNDLAVMGATPLTAGVGVVPQGLDISAANARPGDVVIVSGPIGDHGIAVVSQREGLAFQTTIESDVAPLNGLVAAMVKSQASGVKRQTSTVYMRCVIRPAAAWRRR